MLSLKFIFFISAIVIVAETCTCPEESPHVSYCKADWVAHVKLEMIEGISNASPDGREVYKLKFKVSFITVYKAPTELNGNLPNEIQDIGTNLDCSIQPEGGKEYLLTGTYENGVLKISMCEQLQLNYPMNFKASDFEWNNIRDGFKYFLTLKKNKPC